MLAIFYAQNVAQICTCKLQTQTGGVHEVHRLRAPDGGVHEVYEVHLPSGTFTSPSGGILGANRQVFTPLHSNVSNWVRTLRAVFDLLKPSQKNIFFDTVFDTTRTRFETFEYCSKPTRNVRMQWSKTYLLVPTTPPSGFVICS